MIWRAILSGPGGLERVEQQLAEMLDADRHSFDLAASALLAGADPDSVRYDVSETDHRVNLLVQQVRRELVVHASAHGERADIPALLLYMSIVKDIERVGDYAKDILAIARAGADLSPPAGDRDVLLDYRDRVSQLIADVRRVLAAQDAEEAERLLSTWEQPLRDLDRHVSELVTSNAPAHTAVPRDLYYNYLRRIGAHLMNVLTALVAPLDQLDFWKPPHRPAG